MMPRSTRSCSPTRCATDRSRSFPMPDTPGHGHLRRTCRLAASSSPTGLRWPISCARTCASSFRVWSAVRPLPLDQPRVFDVFAPFRLPDRADWLPVKRLAGWLAVAIRRLRFHLSAHRGLRRHRQTRVPTSHHSGLIFAAARSVSRPDQMLRRADVECSCTL